MRKLFSKLSGVILSLFLFFFVFAVHNHAGAQTVTIWPSSTVPTNPADSNTSAVSLGPKFQSDVAGQITGVRFYKTATNYWVDVVFQQ